MGGAAAAAGGFLAAGGGGGIPTRPEGGGVGGLEARVRWTGSGSTAGTGIRGRLLRCRTRRASVLTAGRAYIVPAVLWVWILVLSVGGGEVDVV